MKQTPKVSICLPTLNARKYLQPRMDAIMSQTLADWELIVCDSYSDDGTWEFFQQYKDDPRVRLHQIPKEGLYAGWNECLRRVHGEYVYIATADDTCSSDFLEKMVSALENTNHITNEEGFIGKTDVALCAWDFIDDKGDVIEPPRRTPDEYFKNILGKKHLRSGYLEFLVHVFLGTSWTTITSVLFRSALLEQIGYFKTDCGAYADRFWGLRLALQSDLIFIPDRLATWRHHEAQASFAPGHNMTKSPYEQSNEELNDLQFDLPAQWTSEAGWLGEFLRRSRNESLACYHLDRHAMSKEKMLFLKGLLLAMVRNPKYAWDRLRHGFSWTDNYYRNDVDRLNEFVAKHTVPSPLVLRNNRPHA